VFTSGAFSVKTKALNLVKAIVMIRQSPARIYTAKQRGTLEDATHRITATFNFEGYADESRKPFGALSVLNDETLGPQQSLTRKTDDATTVLIPLTGALSYSLGAKEQELVPGEAIVISPITKGNTITLKNPYADDLISYLYLVFRGVSTVNFGFNNINLDIRNILHPFIQQGICGYMGIFDGRKEALYTVKNPANGLFAFVINGAFEVNGRLMEERDALALWEAAEADIEALSKNAIIVLFEVPLNSFTA
jgi:hypothetical protein